MTAVALAAATGATPFAYVALALLLAPLSAWSAYRRGMK
jgi:hypothetical protein